MPAPAGGKGARGGGGGGASSSSSSSSSAAAPKGIAMLDLQNDPDRVLHPLRKAADGTFERVSWDTALNDIGNRLKAIRDRGVPHTN
jgi:formate dehydrogenase